MSVRIRTSRGARVRARRRVLPVVTTLVLTMALVPPAGSAGSGAAEDAAYLFHSLTLARWSPADAAGIPDGSIPTPRPPLAWNPNLADSAAGHADEMVEVGYVAHQSPATGLWPNALARAAGYPLPAHLPDTANSIESIQAGASQADTALFYLTSSTGHRYHLYGVGGWSAHGEAGAARSVGGNVWVIHTAYRDPQPVFLTGVAYRDADGDGRYGAGEGLEGVTVAAGGYATVTGAGGVFSLEVPPGDHRVVAAGGPFLGTSAARVTVGDVNVGVEFVSGVEEPVVRAYELCNGLEPTILGTAGDDVIEGTPGDDVIHGLDGNDLIRGNGGDDVICGGRGRDRLNGGPGRDELYGEGGNDRLLGGRGPDHLSGGFGRDRILGQGGRDRVVGNRGDDVLSGTFEWDLEPREILPDRVVGGPGYDVCVPATRIVTCES